MSHDSVSTNQRQHYGCVPWSVCVVCALGGLFELVSGANFLAEIVEWSGYAVATGWSLPAAAWLLLAVCNLAPRAFHHHRPVNVNGMLMKC